MELSIVIICWNDLKVIREALRSIIDETKRIEFEVIVSDNGSSDGSVEYIRQNFPFPHVRVLENKANLGFARGNNAGIEVARGKYVLILNPDTIVHDRALEKLVEFADLHGEAGGFGCRVLNPDGTYQNGAKLFPTVWRFWIQALGLRWLGYFSEAFVSRTYLGWKGDTERVIDWHTGCCVMFRAEVLKRLGGFDPQFFYHCEEVDLCYRVCKAGYSIVFTPRAEITHLGGQSVKRAPARFAIETYRSLYRYFYKHFGKNGVAAIRRPILITLLRQYALERLRRVVLSPWKMDQALESTVGVELKWNYLIKPMQFVETGEEPNLGYEPLAPGRPALAETGAGRALHGIRNN